MPVTGRVAASILTAVLRGGSGQPSRAPRPAVLTRNARPGSPGRGQCGNAEIPGLRVPRRKLCCRAARRSAAALLGCAALGPARRLPMGAVRPPPPAASGAGPKEAVGNRALIGPLDNRSASDRPIRNSRYRSGAFGVGLESDNSSTPGTRAASVPCARLEGCGRRALLGYLPTRLRRCRLGRAREGRGGAAGQRTAREPLTKQLWEGRMASASSSNRPAKLPVTLHRWRWPMTYREGARVGARARGSTSVGLVEGKGFSCHLRQKGKGNGRGEGKGQKTYL